MAKDDSKLQIQLKIDKSKDREIFTVLDVADNKSDFIKDALFYYIHMIEMGTVINRNYPYNKVNIRIDITPEESKPTISNQMSTQIYQHNNDYEEKYNDYEEDDSEDNFDEVDF